jgi:hypothetical protein
MVKTAMAIPRFAGGKLSIKTACEIGCNAPPAAPWITRAMIRKPRLPAIPHRADAIVNKVMQPMRNRLRPKTWPNQLVAGRMIAFESR